MTKVYEIKNNMQHVLLAEFAYYREAFAYVTELKKEDDSRRFIIETEVR